ncbi:FAM45 DENN domain-containing protein [Acrasis kona]|uniref:FAM45 DENN domain-containing protein n=1 Tax=Acrasis kona TaxID=1008807 RepID=A0AAW2ZAX2_9EUKA
MNSLESVLVIEKDTNGDVDVVWAHPTVEDDQKDVVLQRFPLVNEALLESIGQGTNFLFSKYKDSYVYTFVQRNVVTNRVENVKVTDVGICVLSKEFFPEKHFDLLKVLTEIFISSNLDASKVQEAYLEVFCLGTVGSFNADSYDARKAKIGDLASIVDAFKEETVKIWTALLLKKRVLVYSDDVEELTKFVSSLPCLVWHRQHWDLMRPLVNLGNKNETTDLNVVGTYVAGTIDSSAQNNTKYYDLFLDLSNHTVLVAEGSTADFKLIKFHKELAEVLMSPDVKGDSQKLIRAIAVKTKELLAKLNTLKSNHSDQLTLELLENMNLNTDTLNFLYNTALSENMITGA